MDLSIFKNLSLEYYGKEVKVKFKKNSDSHIKYGSSIQGVVIGRIWGERLINKASTETVIALTIRMAEGEREIQGKDILSIHNSNHNSTSDNQQVA